MTVSVAGGCRDVAAPDVAALALIDHFLRVPSVLTSRSVPRRDNRRETLSHEARVCF